MIIAKNKNQTNHKTLSLVEDYPDEDPSEYEGNSCGHSQGRDPPAGSRNQYNHLLRVWGSWLGVGTTDLEVMMRNLTQTISRIARASARAIRDQQRSLDSCLRGT